MPVFTAAAVAIASAVASASVAAIATAAVAVSIAVGTVGLALSVVGAITGDKTLSSVGKYMGYAGMAGGLAGGAIGGIGELSAGGSFLEGASAPFSEVATMTDKIWDKYSELNMFTGSTSIADQAGLLNAGRVAAAAPAATSAAQASVSAVTEPAVGSGTLTPGQIAGTDPALAQGTDPALAQGTSIAEAPTVGAPTVGAPSAVQAPVNPAAASAPAVDTSAYTMAPNQSQVVAPGTGILGVNPAPGAGAVGKLPTDSASFMEFINKNPYLAATLMTSGAQGVGGALGSLFTAATEKEKLAFERERQAFIQGQQGLMNQRTSTAPLLTFDQTRPVQPAGILNQA